MTKLTAIFILKKLTVIVVQQNIVFNHKRENDNNNVLTNYGSIGGQF